MPWDSIIFHLLNPMFFKSKYRGIYSFVFGTATDNNTYQNYALYNNTLRTCKVLYDGSNNASKWEDFVHLVDIQNNKVA